MKKRLILAFICIFIIIFIIYFISIHQSKEQNQTNQEKDILANLENLNSETIANQNTETIIPNEYSEMKEKMETIKLVEPIENSMETIKSVEPIENSTETIKSKEVVEEKKDNTNDITVIKKGVFNPDAEDSDFAHRGSGDISIISTKGKNYITFDNNFKVTNGPNYLLYLSEENNIWTESKFRQVKDKSHSIASIKQFSGAQIFEIPNNIDVQKIQGVTIWCEAFSQFISSANLN